MIDEQLQFPVDFAIKIVATGHPELTEQILTILEAHFPRVERDSVRVRASRKGNYSALTVDVTAETREQLEAAYAQLEQHEGVKWAL